MRVVYEERVIDRIVNAMIDAENDLRSIDYIELTDFECLVLEQEFYSFGIVSGSIPEVTSVIFGIDIEKQEA